MLTTILQFPDEAHNYGVVLWYRSLEFERVLKTRGISSFVLCPWGLGDGVSKRKAFIYAILSLVFLPRLVSILLKLHPKIVHVHSFPANVVFAGLRKIGIFDGILVFTNHAIYGRHSKAQHLLFAWAWRAYDAITTVSETVRQTFIDQYNVADKCSVIPNCVSDVFFSVQDRSESGGKKVFLQIGRFSPVKNHSLVVEALGRMSPDVRRRLEVWFAGDGETREAVEKRARAAGLVQGGTVKFLGFVPHERLPDVMRQVDYGLFPSDLEGFGIAAAECLAAGRPVLALRNALMEEVVGDAGMLCAKEKLEGGFAKMLNDGDCLVAKARDKAARYRADAVRKKYHALYRRLIECRGVRK